MKKNSTGEESSPKPKHDTEHGLTFMVDPTTMLKQRDEKKAAFHVLVLGQSNVANHCGTPMTSGFGRVFHQGAFSPLEDPVIGGTGTKGSVWTRFAPLLEASGMAQDLILSLYATGATSMADWSAGGGCYEALEAAIPSIQACPVAPTHVVFHQGEADNLRDTAPEHYVAQFESLYALVSGAFPKAAWIFCRASFRQGVISNRVRKAQRKIVNSHPNIRKGPDTDELGDEFRHDCTHFNDEGLSRFAEALVRSFAAKRAGKVKPNAPEVKAKPSPPASSPEKKPEVRLIVACMPKSGSTLLTELIANLPGMRRVTLVPGFQRREQELCLRCLDDEIIKSKLLLQLWRQNKELMPTGAPKGFVCQMHIRYTKPTSDILSQYGILPIVLVRNIFDTVVSLRDHIVKSAPYMSMGYVSEEMRSWPDDKMYHFIADMVVPWYLNFFLCWTEHPSKILVTYEELTSDPEGTMLRLAEYAGVRVESGRIRSIIDAIDGSKTRKNHARAGRGETLPPEVQQKIRDHAAYYSGYDLSAIGL